MRHAISYQVFRAFPRSSQTALKRELSTFIPSFITVFIRPVLKCQSACKQGLLLYRAKNQYILGHLALYFCLNFIHTMNKDILCERY